MPKLVVVKSEKVKEAHENLKKEIAKHPEAQEFEQRLEKEREEHMAKEKARRDAEHAAKMAEEAKS